MTEPVELTAAERKKWRKTIKGLPFLAVKKMTDVEGEIGKLARKEYLKRLVAMLVDDLLGYDEPGWHSVSPMYGAIEYQGVMPQDVRQSGGDRMMNAAIRLRDKSPGWVLLDWLPPRQLVALLVNDLRQRQGLTQAQACEPKEWERLVAQLQLSRFFEPALLGGMQGNLLRVHVNAATAYSGEKQAA